MGDYNAPFGLRPIGRLGAGGQETFRQFPIASGYAMNIACGDVVKLVDIGTSTVIQKQSAPGNTTTAIDMCGVFIGCSYTDPVTGQLTISQMWPANTVASDAMAFVVENPDTLFAVQASAAPTNPGDIYGKNAAFVQNAPNTAMKVSRMTVDVATLGTQAALPVRVIDYLGGAQGDEAGSAYPVLVVKLNTHQMTSTTGAA